MFLILSGVFFNEKYIKMLKIFKTIDKENQLKILRAHPDLADKTKIGLLTTNSRTEQNS